MSDVNSQANRQLVFTSLLLACFALGLEGMIVATGMPNVISKLGGFNYYTLVVSAFLLSQSSAVVICGKLGDAFGRKPILLSGIGLFVFGSLLCGFASSMTSLILFRLIQGFGAGAAGSIMNTIVGDLYTLDERERLIAVLSVTSIISSLLGPAVGSLIVTNLSWRWIFWCTVPFGIATILCLTLFLKESLNRRNPYIDYIGAVLFFVSIGTLILFINKPVVGFALSSVGAAALFICYERRVPEPMISFELWGRRLIATCGISVMLISMTLSLMESVLPIYIQGVQGYSPLAAGLTLTALVIGDVLGIFLAVRLRRFVGIKCTSIILTATLPLGSTGLIFLGPESSPVSCAAITLFMGIGTCPPFLFGMAAVQSSVNWSSRGSATACIMFAASLGSIIGSTLLGACISAGISYYAPGSFGQSVHQLLDQHGGLSQLAFNPAVRAVLDNALHWPFAAVLLLATLTFAATCSVPMAEHDSPSRRKPSRADS